MLNLHNFKIFIKSPINKKLVIFLLVPNLVIKTGYLILNSKHSYKNYSIKYISLIIYDLRKFK